MSEALQHLTGYERDNAVAQPEHAEYRVAMRNGFNQCPKCHRALPNAPSFRCPYVSCRVWLIGYGDPQPEKKRRKLAKEDHQ